jgi:predicted dehydrogenase
MSERNTNRGIDRRSFLRSAAAVGAPILSGVLSPAVLGQAGGSKKEDDIINVALLGVGEQGDVLMNSCRNIPGVRFKAVCDVWEAWNLKRMSNKLKKYKIEHNTYTDYKEMLDKEKGLQAVIIATPDFWHAEQTVDCLKAGLHVYCEKEMSNTLEGAKKMVQAVKETGKLLQIGHQRRSNPRYLHCYDKLIKDAKLLGRLTTINGQWNRSKVACEDLLWPKGTDIDEATLQKYGFKSMQQFRNWRWYKGLGGGPIIDLGSHQIDIYSWFLEANPKSVMASGGTDYWKGREWYDNAMAIYEYETKQGIVRAFYQTITTNTGNGYFELFMGDEGTLLISESSGRGDVYREKWLPDDHWDKWVKAGYLKAPPEEKKEEKPAAGAEAAVDVRESPKPPRFDLPVTMNKPYHQPHLENFFDAIRGKAKLTCPAEVGYETTVTVLKVNEAIEAGKKLEFKPEDFKV